VRERRGRELLGALPKLISLGLGFLHTCADEDENEDEEDDDADGGEANEERDKVYDTALSILHHLVV